MGRMRQGIGRTLSIPGSMRGLCGGCAFASVPLLLLISTSKLAHCWLSSHCTELQ